MTRPLVLITVSDHARGVEFNDPSLSLSQNYALAVHAAGGIPWALPILPDRGFVADSVARCDGVLLTGGEDVQTELYAPKLSPALRRTAHAATPERDVFELMVIDEVFRQRKPLLAICRGHQLLNVAFGGTLLVDIAAQKPDALNYRRMDMKDKIVHDVDILPGTFLAEVAGPKRLGVNSSHHQAMQIVAKPLRANAVSLDGIVEGAELEADHRDVYRSCYLSSFIQSVCGRGTKGIWSCSEVSYARVWQPGD